MMKGRIGKKQGCGPGWVFSPKTMSCHPTDKNIVINIYRGVVDSVQNVPAGWSYIVNDVD